MDATPSTAAADRLPQPSPELGPRHSTEALLGHFKAVTRRPNSLQFSATCPGCGRSLGIKVGRVESGDRQPFLVSCRSRPRCSNDRLLAMVGLAYRDLLCAEEPVNDLPVPQIVTEPEPEPEPEPVAVADLTPEQQARWQRIADASSDPANAPFFKQAPEQQGRKGAGALSTAEPKPVSVVATDEEIARTRLEAALHWAEVFIADREADGIQPSPEEVAEVERLRLALGLQPAAPTIEKESA